MRPTFYEFLNEARRAIAYDRKHYGLSVALGGEEVTMEDVVTPTTRCLHPMAGPDASPPRTRLEAARGTVRAPFGAEASFLSASTCSRASLAGSIPSARRRALAWKTGTSHGFRDAWAVAVCGRGSMLAVWISNFDGTPNPAFVNAHVRRAAAFSDARFPARGGVWCGRGHFVRERE